MGSAWKENWDRNETLNEANRRRDAKRAKAEKSFKDSFKTGGGGPGGSGKAGCFIATATYGSPFAPEVLVFRRFRDEILVTSRLGNALVNLYYLMSPPLARLISKTRFLKIATRHLLLEPISRLVEFVLRIHE